MIYNSLEIIISVLVVNYSARRNPYRIVLMRMKAKTEGIPHFRQSRGFSGDTCVAGDLMLFELIVVRVHCIVCIVCDWRSHDYLVVRI